MYGTPSTIVTDAEMNAIASPAVGLQVYNRTQNMPLYWNGIAWIPGNNAGNLLEVKQTIVGNTAIANTFTTPLVVLAAPGAGNIWIPVQGSMILTGTPFTNDAMSHYPAFIYQGATNTNLLLCQGFAYFTANQFNTMAPVNSAFYINKSNMVNMPISFITYLNALSGGDGTTTVTLTLSYYMASIP
jgi:hypothetical protein